MRPFLLKAGKVFCVILVTIISIVFLGPAANPVLASDITVVTITGRVTNPNPAIGTARVHATASGTTGSLSGMGSDNGIPGNPKGTCTFPLTGTLTGSVVTLSGVVTFSNNPSFIGTNVTLTANASTGSITFNFGGFIFTGTGSVVIAAQ